MASTLVIFDAEALRGRWEFPKEGFSPCKLYALTKNLMMKNFIFSGGVRNLKK